MFSLEYVLFVQFIRLHEVPCGRRQNTIKRHSGAGLSLVIWKDEFSTSFKRVQWQALVVQHRRTGCTVGPRKANLRCIRSMSALYWQLDPINADRITADDPEAFSPRHHERVTVNMQKQRRGLDSSTHGLRFCIPEAGGSSGELEWRGMRTAIFTDRDPHHFWRSADDQQTMHDECCRRWLIEYLNCTA